MGDFDCCCGLLHPGEYTSRIDDHDRGRRGFRHYYAGRRLAVVTDGMAAVDHSARREYHDSERQDSRAWIPVDYDSAWLRRKQRAADSYVQDGRVHRALVDGRCVRRYFHRGSHSAPAPDVR